MRLLTGIAFGLILLAAPVVGDPHKVIWTRVSDPHGSSLELPLTILKRKPNSSETAFQADDGKVQITFDTVTESRFGFPGNDPEGDMDVRRSDCTNWPPSYYVLKPQLAAYSCTKGNDVAYYVARYSPSGSVTLYVKYPQAESSFWNRAVSRMSASMRQITRQEIR